MDTETAVKQQINNNVDVSIVIVSWNTKELLRECLDSVYKYTVGVTFEVFVVDNASADGSVEMVQELFPDVKLIANNDNAGFSKANNQAIVLSKGRYAAILNPDTVLIEDVFSPLISYADKDARIGAIGPKIFNSDGKTIQYVCARKLPNLYFEFCRLSGLQWRFSKTRLFGGEYMSYWDHNSSRKVEGLSGACMVVRRDIIDKVGLMDENQFMYGDEIDWCRRMLDADWDIFYYADTALIHYGGVSSAQVKIQTSIESEKALRYYYLKHKGREYARLFVLLVLLFSGGKYLWSLCFWEKNERVRDLMMGYKSLYRWARESHKAVSHASINK
jgi:GT2 family glycosyltransferase